MAKPRIAEAAHSLTPSKAKKIMEDGMVKGNPLTGKQKGYFGARAGGAPVKPGKKKSKKKGKKD